MQTKPRHILIPPHAEHIQAYFHSPRMQNISGHILIPSPAYKIYPAYFYPPPPHTKHIRSIFLFPSPAYKTYPEHILIPLPRMQTEPEHVFDCPHVCDGCTVRTDAIRHERTDVRKTRWTMKMYSGSVPSGNPFYSPAPSPSGNPIIRFSSFPFRESNYPLLQLPRPGIQLSASLPGSILSPTSPAPSYRSDPRTP